jgi:hypothetical protein
MRIYTDKQLEGRTPEQFQKMLNQVKTNSELTHEEKTANIQKLETYMNDSKIRTAIMKDIIAGQADTDDIMEN